MRWIKSLKEYTVLSLQEMNRAIYHRTLWKSLIHRLIMGWRQPDAKQEQYATEGEKKCSIFVMLKQALSDSVGESILCFQLMRLTEVSVMRLMTEPISQSLMGAIKIKQCRFRLTR